jgi:asparagine synthase (glutamine-hydrolysing)
MCGIAGMVSAAGLLPNAHALTRITNTLSHRGPDGEGQWYNKRHTVCFGHRRLKIIDLSDAAAQPMHRQNRYTIVYNGEIYNYIELRNTLQAKGAVFQTASDTEVILAAYAAYGKDCLQYLEGMFAFAIWDEQEQQLFAARDRFGEKPFYYHIHPEVFSFASEMKALWAAGIEKIPDPEMMLLYLGLGTSNIPQQPERTFFSNICSLPPAHALTIKTGETTPRIFQYWKLEKEPASTLKPADAIEQFRTLFQQSVTLRMRSDVPTGTCLSGGLDSASVVAACHRTDAPQYRHTCFTASFPGFEKDETALAATTARSFNLKQVLVTPVAGNMEKDLEAMLYHQEQPVISSSAYAQYCVFRAAKENGITVLLDGQGADEILAGYNRYLHWYLQELAFTHPLKMRRELQSIRRNNLPLKWGVQNYAAALMPSFTAKKLQQRAVQQITHHTEIDTGFINAHFNRHSIYKPPVKNLNDILHFTATQQGLGDLLHMADRNSMAHGVEVRLPFLSTPLVAFVFSLPATFKIHNGFTKWLLRETMKEVLPATITANTIKTGFETPQAEWMKYQSVTERVVEARRKLQTAGILRRTKEDIHPVTSNEQEWRYLCAANFIG